MKITKEADKMLKWIYNLYLKRLPLSKEAVWKEFSYLSKGEFRAVLNYLGDKERIDFYWMLSSPKDKQQPFGFRKYITARGIDWVEK